MSTEPIYIGTRTGYGSDPLFGLLPADARHHTYLIGKTGSGKSTLLRNLILQHLANGSGLALIDPHGDLAEEVLDHFPAHRAEQLVYFNPADAGFPLGINPIANVPKDQRPLVTDGIVGAFKSLWRDSWGPRMEYILAHTVAALLECQNTSLLGINRMLADPAYRDAIVRRIEDPQIRFFWTEEFARYDPRFLREAIAPIQNKVGQFTLHPTVRCILGQVGAKVNFRFMMDSGRIFIANLSKGKLGAEKANLLGSLLVTQFQLAAMSRADQPEAERRDFHLFIDEFHNFTTDSFASILAEARKYRLCLTLSHQYFDQLALPVRQAVFGNVGTMVAFRVGHTDAEVLEKEFGKAFGAAQFADLDRYEVLLRLLEHGQQRQPFRGQTLAPLATKQGRRDRLIARSREKYATPREVIEERLARWMSSR